MAVPGGGCPAQQTFEGAGVSVCCGLPVEAPQGERRVPPGPRSGMARCGQRVGRAASVTPRSWHPVSLGQTICSCFRVPTLRKRPSPTRLRPRPTATLLREREEASGRPGALVGCRDRVSAGLSSPPPPSQPREPGPLVTRPGEHVSIQGRRSPMLTFSRWWFLNRDECRCLRVVTGGRRAAGTEWHCSSSDPAPRA